jgi:hypothetical protein
MTHIGGGWNCKGGQHWFERFRKISGDLEGFGRLGGVRKVMVLGRLGRERLGVRKVGAVRTVRGLGRVKEVSGVGGGLGKLGGLGSLGRR